MFLRQKTQKVLGLTFLTFAEVSCESFQVHFGVLADVMAEHSFELGFGRVQKLTENVPFRLCSPGKLI